MGCGRPEPSGWPAAIAFTLVAVTEITETELTRCASKPRLPAAIPSDAGSDDGDTGRAGRIRRLDAVHGHQPGDQKTEQQQADGCRPADGSWP